MEKRPVRPAKLCRRDFIRLLISTGFLAGCRRVSPAPTPTTASGATLALVGGTLIDGTGADPLPDATLLIQGKRIMAVGQALEVPAGVPTLDAQGATILPGFINTHVHRSYDESTLKAWAQDGVTTVRDMGNGENRRELFAFRDRVRDDPQCARLVAVGPIVTVPGGYPIAPWGGSGLAVTSPQDARRKVRRLLDDGADLVKIALETGAIFQQRIPTLSFEQALAITQVAREQRVRVTAHVTTRQGLETALDVGVDDLAHTILTGLPDALIDRTIEAGTYWIPTLELWKCVSEDNPVVFDRTAIANLRSFATAGGKVALGTDYGGYTTRLGIGMPMVEIEMMQDAGMTPMQIIVAATRHAAHVCDLGDAVGTLKEGTYADILVVNGDPLADIHALTDAKLVVREGVVIRQ